MDILQKRTRNDMVRLLYDEQLVTLSEEYHEASKINRINGRSYRRRIHSILGPEFFLKIISQSYKTYPTAEIALLPSDKELSEPSLARSLRKIILKRRSVRSFTGQPITIDNLSTMLRNAYGITGSIHSRYTLQASVSRDWYRQSIITTFASIVLKTFVLVYSKQS
jgi:hypothetical protein